MEMDDNYRDAVYRMYESSDVLFEKQQWFNVNYLAGYVLECYCKLILLMAVGQGYAFSGGQQKVRKFGHAVSELRDEVDFIRLGSCAVAGYCIDVQEVCPNILGEWNPNKRYGADSSVLNTEALAVKIHTEMEALMDMVIKMEVDGVLA